MLFGTAVTIQSGKLDRFRRLDEELDEHRGEYAELNERYRVRAHSVWVSHQLDGTPIAVNIYDIDPAGLEDMAKRQWDLDSAYDRWWVGWVSDVYGIDLLGATSHAAPPERVFGWESGRQPG